MSAYAKPLPQIDDRNRGFWEGLKRHELCLLRCGDCGHYRYQSYKTCPACAAETSNWVKVSGRGTVWSFGFFHKAYFKGFVGEMPYNVVAVALDEGPRIYSNLVGVAKDDIRIGMTVEAVYEDVTPEVTLVKFRPLR